jgi:hypothetical protein
MVGDTSDLARLDASRLLLQRRSSELHGRLILLALDGRQGTLLGSPAVRLFLAAIKVEVDAVAANLVVLFVLVIVPDTGGMPYVGTRPPQALRPGSLMSVIWW